MQLWQLCSLSDQDHGLPWRPLQVVRTALGPGILMCSLFSPSPGPDAASQGTKNFGVVSAEGHEDCHCFLPLLEWGSHPVHPREKVPVCPGSAPAASRRAEHPSGVLLPPQQCRAGWSGPEPRGSPGGARRCLPWRGEGVGEPGPLPGAGAAHPCRCGVTGRWRGC